MFYYTYILESIQYGNLYIGFTTDLTERIKKHSQGLNVSTKPYKPWRLIYYEAFLNKGEAQRREKYLKTNQGARMLKRKLKDYFYEKPPKH